VLTLPGARGRYGGVSSTRPGWCASTSPDMSWPLGGRALVANARAWVRTVAGDEATLVFVDAPLVVDNPSGQRDCERQVGQRYGRWQVSANSTNEAGRHRAGVTLRQLLEQDGWSYDDGHGGPPRPAAVPYASATRTPRWSARASALTREEDRRRGNPVTLRVGACRWCPVLRA
jgi:hypothetical protein